MGAWIEIAKRNAANKICFCRSSRGSVDWNTHHIPIINRLFVAPLVGAWIEIKLVWDKVQSMIVAPLVGAWIEIRVKSQQNVLQTVAPLVGAWIEMSKNLYWTCYAWVAPLVGAWIEIVTHNHGPLSEPSLLSWERGLKYPMTKIKKRATALSLLSWERGLK